MINNIEKESLKNCIGCGICACVCPKKCISMELDKDGYFEAVVKGSCIHCGQCVKVCRKYQNENETEGRFAQHIYVGYYRDERIRKVSSSGGIATAIAKWAVENEYVVMGAAMNSNGVVEHIVISDKNKIKQICGSKYVPSYTVEAFSKILKYKKVLVFGTPCQIQAIRKAYPNHENLILVDFKCFGPAGYNLLNKYIEYQKEENKSNITWINMRSKRRDWLNWGIEIKFQSGKHYFKQKQFDLFGKCFSTYGAVRKDCLECLDLKAKSFGDIRLEDAWSYMDYGEKNDFKMGLSQISTFNQKGERIVKALGNRIQAESVENRKVEHEISSHSYKKKLMELLRDDDKDLKSIVKEYEKTLTFAEKLYYRLCFLADYNPYVYSKLHKIYKGLKRKHSHKG
ncbi:MAG: hypothetical protein HFI78_00505 [Lachnospiraceae bacterium]|jgi:coenzyme F420-reducing hydrogenase beta subunit|nr:hypothetical protein [Lachnospiraceae bacterium]